MNSAQQTKSILPRYIGIMRSHLLSSRPARSILLAMLPIAVSPCEAVAQQVAPTSIQQPNVDRRRMSPDQVREVAPALEQYTQQHLYGEVWKRPGLSPRDRSLVSIAALITRGEAPALGYYANQAIENGVKPAEISEMITHLAFYAGWGRAMAAIGPVREVFAARHIAASALPPAFGPLQPIDDRKDAPRASSVSRQFDSVSPGTVAYTNGLLFRELWLRPYLSQRDRSLVTIASLVASGNTEQLAYHIDRGMDQGLTATEIGEAFTQLAFYAGWPAAFAAMPVAKTVYERRSAATDGK